MENVGMPRKVEDIEKVIGDNLASARKAKEMTLKELADKLGISFQQVQKYENGKNRISASQALKIAKILGCPVDRLVGTCFDENLSNSKKENKRVDKDSYNSFLNEMSLGLSTVSDLIGSQVADELINHPEKRTENLFSLSIFWMVQAFVKREQFLMTKK
jgi:transcriptional regulator with XRE-family HTH domain